MEDYLRAVLFGVIQALTEFLPISSSGHLVLAAELLGDEANDVTYDVALHGGTTVAVLVYFRRDWWLIGTAALRDARAHGLALRLWRGQGRLGLLLALGSVPAAAAGAVLQATVEDGLRQPLVVGIMLIGVGALMWVVDTRARSDRAFGDVTPRGALWIGAAQALALVPGTSRSGATITAGRALGLSRYDAARFSFLLSAPIVLGSFVVLLGDAARHSSEFDWGPMALGAAVSAVAGLFVIRGLLGFLRRHGLTVFVWYRFALGAVVLAGVATGAL